LSEKERETKDSDGTDQPEGAERESAASNTLNQDDISKLFGDRGADEKEGQSQNRQAEPSQDIDHGDVTPVKDSAHAEGLDGKGHMEEGEGESPSGMDGSESIEGAEVEAQEAEELLAQLEILEDEPAEGNSHDDPQEDKPDGDDVSVDAHSGNDLSSEKGDAGADENRKRDGENEERAHAEEQGAVEREEEAEEDGQGQMNVPESVEEHDVEDQSDEACIAEDGDSEGQEADDDRENSTSVDNPQPDQKDNEVSAADSDKEPSSKRGDKEDDENLEMDSKDDARKDEKEEDLDVFEVVNPGEQGEDEDDMALQKDEDDEDIEDEHRAKRGKKALLLLIGLLSCVIVVAGMAGWVLHKRYALESPKKEVRVPVKQMNVSDGETEAELPQPRPSHVTRGPATLVDKLEARLQEAATLRDELLIKAGEIDRLKGHFSESIGKTEKEILQENKTHEIASYRQALNNKKVELGLRTIQRREAYIRQLDQASEWLEGGSQELLYVRRKTLIDMEASKIAGGIDLERLITDLEGVIQKNRRGIQGLTVDMGTTKLHPLEAIWSRLAEEENPQARGKIYTQRRANKGQADGHPLKKGNRDSEIWEEVCSGNYARKGELTELSVQAAKSLSKIKISDLFLNGLTQLSPEAAKHLMKWKGDWICLNGLKQVLPETGKSLFQWPGKVISLNGLSSFPPEFAPLLLKWQGTQLELMGLEPSHDIGQLAGIKALAQWEESGGKLYVPDDIRKQIEHVMGGSG